jgi:predicted secreted protein
MAIKTGVGTILKIDGSTIGNVTNITGPSMSKDTIDTTALDTTGGYRTFITGFKNAGTLTFTLMFEKAHYSKLKSAFDSDVAKSIEVILPDGATAETGSKLSFSGFVTEIPLTIPPDDKITCDVTIQISGPVTFTPAA